MDASEQCALCNKANDQMLMLSCVHDPCIHCAATAFADQVHIKGHSSEIYICEVCGHETMLDASTVAELNSLSKNVIKSPSKRHGSPTAPISKGVGPVTSNSSQLKKKENPASPKKVVYYCKDHSQQEITYYCFTCWVTICPECAIHGAHKDHDVKLTKKAILDVKGQYIQIISKIGGSLNTMTKYKDGYLRLVKETNERHTREKILVSRQFQLMRNALVVREKEMLKELDEINRQNTIALTASLEGINENQEDVNKVRKSIEMILKKDDVLILEDYKHISQHDEKVAALTKTSETVIGEVNNLNTEFLQQEAKELTETVAAIKLGMKKQELLHAMNLKHLQAHQPNGAS